MPRCRSGSPVTAKKEYRSLRTVPAPRSTAPPAPALRRWEALTSNTDWISTRRHALPRRSSAHSPQDFSTSRETDSRPVSPLSCHRLRCSPASGRADPPWSSRSPYTRVAPQRRHSAGPAPRLPKTTFPRWRSQALSDTDFRRPPTSESHLDLMTDFAWHNRLFATAQSPHGWCTGSSKSICPHESSPHAYLDHHLRH